MDAGSSHVGRTSAAKKKKIDELACQKLKLTKLGLRKKLEQQDRLQIEELLAQIKTLQSSMETLSAEHEKEKARMGREAEKALENAKELQQMKFTAIDRERARKIERLLKENEELKEQIQNQDGSLQAEVDALRSQVSQLQAIVEARDKKVSEQQTMIHKLLGFCAAAKSKLKLFKKTKHKLAEAESQANHYDLLLKGALGDLEDTKTMLSKAQTLYRLEKEKHMDDVDKLNAMHQEEVELEKEALEQRLRMQQDQELKATSARTRRKFARELEKEKKRAEDTMAHQRQVLNTAIARLKQTEEEKKSLLFDQEVLQLQFQEQRNKYMQMLQEASQMLREEQQKHQEDNEKWSQLLNGQMAELRSKVNQPGPSKKKR
mmetsp:Transcript_15678/g.61236  ORF Transcript_15678/g.61236 Transcript_15678/m.61236 type:complete len:376 (-) Transcript_15678:53-1180(-)